MAGGSQHGFNFPAPMVSHLRPGEIVVDLFAGGGGASEALRQALGHDPDIAINHDAHAIGMHAANHPLTKHMQEDVWHADPVAEVAGRSVGWFHASPDCTHFSQAKGGQPRSRATRSLSWVVLKWAGQLLRVKRAPRIISLENVAQILKWGPLVAKRCKATGRVIKLDGTTAAKGERVPLELQHLIPDPKRAGQTWAAFVAALRALGYTVEWRKLIASDFGAGTSRTRLFMVARRDGEAIQWPAPTHGTAPGLLPQVTAADCIDFSQPCPSIFTRKRPLAEATLRRIAKGLKRFVLDAAEPYFITEHANATRAACWSAHEPLRTQCANVKGGHFALATATVVKFRGDSAGSPINQPLPTITSGAGAKRPAGAAHALGVMTAFLEQANGGYYTGAGHDLRNPMPTVCANGSHQRLVTGELAQLAPEHEAGALRVAAFLINYYGNGQALNLREPVDTITTRDRIALVTVTVQGVPFVIVDIGLRMLRREELFRAQGFPADYIIDRAADGTPLSISRSVKMVGNSVSPPPLCAIARANLDQVPATERMAA